MRNCEDIVSQFGQVSGATSQNTKTNTNTNTNTNTKKIVRILFPKFTTAKLAGGSTPTRPKPTLLKSGDTRPNQKKPN